MLDPKPGIALTPPIAQDDRSKRDWSPSAAGSPVIRSVTSGTDISPAPVPAYGAFQVGNIRNFAWVSPSLVARGEQPHIGDYAALADLGVRAIISLREAQAPPDDVWAAYSAADEAQACKAAGLIFRHLPCLDKYVPDPETVAAAVAAVDEEVAAGRPVFIHCLFGVGRTGLVAAAWSMARTDRDLGVIATEYFGFFNQMYERNGVPRESYEAQHREYRVLNQWWALVAIAVALGLEVRMSHPFPPEPPTDAADWLRRCRWAFLPWCQRSNR